MKDKDRGSVRIGCFGGFWGDSMAMAVGQFLRSKESEAIDFLVSDYLAEVTMCILAKKKKQLAAKQKKLQQLQQQQGKAPPRTAADERMGEGGYVEDFAKFIWKPFGKILMAKGIRVVVNAGGMNPLGLKAAVEAISAKWETKPLVAAVTGDDLLLGGKRGTAEVAHMLDAFAVDGNVDDKDDAVPPTAKLLSANAYVGSAGIAKAVAAGADVIVVGRCVDSAMVLGPLAAEHGWGLPGVAAPEAVNYDRLAAGTIAGHVIECGAQCTGGNFTDWELSMHKGISASKYFENIGFPLIDVFADGTFEVFKPSATGGIVSKLSVSEQLVYEIGDPASYSVPDVRCDMRQLIVEEIGRDRVRVSNVRGNAPSGNLKVTATFSNGHMITLTYGYVGRDALFKAKAVTKTIIGRANKQLAQFQLPPFSAVRAEYFGGNETHYGPSRRLESAREVVVRLTAHHATNPKAFAFLAMHIPSASTGMAPGLFSLTTSRVMPSESIVLRSALVPAASVPVSVHIGETAAVAVAPPSAPAAQASAPPPSMEAPSAGDEQSDSVSVPLITIACCRSGDKGDAANIGVVARDPKYYGAIVAQVTEERVAAHCSAWMDSATKRSEVRRFFLPGMNSLNFVLSHVLGGGGLNSLKGDKQGKSLGGILLDLPVKVPRAWLEEYENGVGRVKQAILSRL